MKKILSFIALTMITAVPLTASHAVRFVMRKRSVKFNEEVKVRFYDKDSFLMPVDLSPDSSVPLNDRKQIALETTAAEILAEIKAGLPCSVAAVPNDSQPIPSETTTAADIEEEAIPSTTPSRSTQPATLSQNFTLVSASQALIELAALAWGIIRK